MVRLLVARWPRRVELMQELQATVVLIGLADGGGDPLQAGQGPEEPAVGLVFPAHVGLPMGWSWSLHVCQCVLADSMVCGICSVGLIPQLLEEKWPRHRSAQTS